MQPKYRPEIDGLRTIAVLAVMAYHAEFTFEGIKLLKGGFLGVDVFFVISGFLITLIILSELQQNNRFSISHFYERRARRILPALFAIILCSLPFAWNLLLPNQLVEFSRSILSTLIFGSNFYWDLILQEYAAESSLLKPFLHTWSLSVEEQYYIIFPFILILLHRHFQAYAITILFVALLISLVFAESITLTDKSFSFYMLPSRFWELLTGALLAKMHMLNIDRRKDSFFYKSMPTLGLALILISMIFVDIKSNHPGFITLTTIIGTALIIWFGSKGEFVTRLLSTQAFVNIGLISYSLYLWHYPIYAFGRYIDSTPLWYDKALWIILTFLLSSITYSFIEKPFRNSQKVSSRLFLVWLGVTLSIILSTTLYWSTHQGVDSRVSYYLSSVFKKSNRIWVDKDGQKCHSGGGGRKPAFPLAESCHFEHQNNASYIIVIGDSHAGSLAENVRLLAKENSYNFLQLTNAGCPHIQGISTNKICSRRSNNLIPFLSSFHDPIVIYNSRLPLFLEMEKFDNLEGDREANYKTISKKHIMKNRPIREKALLETLNELKKVSKNLVIVYPVPEQGFNIRDKLFSHKNDINSYADLPTISTNYKTFTERSKSSYAILNKVTGKNTLKIYPEKIFCTEETGRCLVSDKDKIYYSFDNHVSPLGSKLIVDKIAEKLHLSSQLP